jgi:argininosuccinate lyase
MPHKKNPDVFELIRGKCNKIQSLPNEITILTNNLPSGYHRDFQLTKECLFPAISDLHDCIDMTCIMMEKIQVRENIMEDEKYKLAFSVEGVNEEVKKGIPFREAYNKVAKMLKKGNFSPSKKLHHVHEGSIGNLCNDKIRIKMKELSENFRFEKAEKALKILVSEKTADKKV